MFLSLFTPREDPEWYYAESLTTGKQGYIPYNFIAMTTVETEPYVSPHAVQILISVACPIPEGRGSGLARSVKKKKKNNN